MEDKDDEILLPPARSTVRFVTEQELEQERQEFPGRREQAPVVDSRSLYERLKAARDDKEQEWNDEHNAFRAPASLDEDDYEYYIEREKERRQRDDELRVQEDRLLSQFQEAAARSSLPTSQSSVLIPPGPIAAHPKTSPPKPTPHLKLPVAVKVVPKTKTLESRPGKRSDYTKEENERGAIQPTPKKPRENAPLAGLLEEYNSGSESE